MVKLKFRIVKHLIKMNQIFGSRWNELKKNFFVQEYVLSLIIICILILIMNNSLTKYALRRLEIKEDMILYGLVLFAFFWVLAFLLI